MPTIRDVARRAGVAPTTVSRVINNSGYTSAETRARVEAAIHELQYVPNTLSQSLRYKRTNTLALVLSDITNPFWTTVTRGVEDAASEQDMHVFLCNTDEKPDKTASYVEKLLQRQTDGFLFVPTGADTAILQKIKKQSVPLVVLDRTVEGVVVDVVRSDSLGGAQRLTEYLIRLGHRRIAIIPGPPNIATSVQRLEGYRRALAKHNIPYDDTLVRHGRFNHENGVNVAITTTLLNDLSPPPTVIFAGNNFIALGVLQAIRQAKLRVPEDISVVSFDDVPYNWEAEPFLTVVSQDPYKLGMRAAELLLKLITSEEQAGSRDIVLPVELLERRSCRPLTDKRP
jgi:LacI family transcriptional regulator